MKGQLKASTPAEYMEQLEEPRKSEIVALDAIIRKAAPKLEPFVQMGILAYGHTSYKNAAGKEIDWFKIGVSSNKNYISLYGCGKVAHGYKKALPKAKIGKGCVNIKRLGDLDQAALKKMIQEGAKA